MARFVVGEEVIALTNPRDHRSQPRQKGKFYKVKAVSFCEQCGKQSINLGMQSSSKFIDCGCGGTSSTQGLMWTLSSHFVSSKFAEEEMYKAAEMEDYERASLLRDALNLQK